ncbi:ParA family protein [Cohnella thermotolerans]|uniref:ParA family protein n=1 Tax=Cohnella thermotolerans TaxID=329858 RepID=UPI0004065F17|nr:ParA family protein [Cohnella thermotolerans]
MSRRIVLAVPEPQYAAKLARYLKENNPDWEVAAFTQEAALVRHIREAAGAEALLVQASLLPLVLKEAEAAGYRGKLIALAERDGTGRGAEMPELAQYQPLSALSAKLRDLLGGGRSGGSGKPSGTQVWTVFSASGGEGKTTAALNMAKQAGERGYRTFYLNLEPLNATDVLFGAGEPDSLSRLLYSLHARPEQAAEEWNSVRRRHPWLQADYFDAPDMPSERLAMTPDRLKSLLATVADSGRYDLILVDPDSGCGDWHRELLALSGRIIWLTLDDALALRKAEKLVRHWEDRLAGFPGNAVFVANKHTGRSSNAWILPGPAPAAHLPYVPQWKALEQPGRLFQSPAYGGAIDRLLDLMGLAAEPLPEERRDGAHEGGGAYACRTG